MPLQQSLLKQYIFNALQRVKDGSVKINNVDIPNIPIEVCRELSTAYDNWVKACSPTAGPLFPMITPASKQSLEQSLSLPFMKGWGPGFMAYWSSIVFSGPGFIPANPVVPVSLVSAMAGITAEISVYIPAPSPPPGLINSDEEFADKLAQILNMYTKSLQILATTTSSPPVISSFGVS